ncbi:hypothetical protein RFI_03362, partial [Reticulomyxa filosa]
MRKDPQQTKNKVEELEQHNQRLESELMEQKQLGIMFANTRVLKKKMRRKIKKIQIEVNTRQNLNPINLHSNNSNDEKSKGETPRILTRIDVMSEINVRSGQEIANMTCPKRKPLITMIMIMIVDCGEEEHPLKGFVAHGLRPSLNTLEGLLKIATLCEYCHKKKLSKIDPTKP